MNFGGSSWNTSSGFGSSAPGASAGGGLFGNSSSNANPGSNIGNAFGSSTLGGGLFGNSLANAPKPPGSTLGGGLFGSSTGSKPAGGLFGNTATQNQSSGLFGSQGSQQPSSGGLFGNSNTGTNNTSTTGGGLFGSSSNQNSTGLFGKPPAPSTGGGLFGNSSLSTQPPAGGGLFGSSSQPAQPGGGGGLFGNSNTTQNKPLSSLFLGSGSGGGGLFGNSSSNTGGLNQAPAGGLFGSSSTQPGNTGSGGLFGNKLQAPATGGLFGNSGNAGSSLFNKPASGGGLFGNQANPQPGAASLSSTASAANPNPYKADEVLASIQNTAALMPASLTGSLFSGDKLASRGVNSLQTTSTDRPKSAKMSLLSKLSKTFNIFRKLSPSQSENGNRNLKGLFAQLNYVKPIDSIGNSRNGTLVAKNKLKHSTSKLNSKDLAGAKRLIIKSKPLKYHLINANRVISSKRKRIQAADTVDDESFTDDEIAASGFAEKANRAESDNHHLFSQLLSNENPDNDVEQQRAPEQAQSSEDIYDGYWCTPSLEDLSRLDSITLSNVDNFIIGRKGHGQIAYNFPVDLSRIFYEADGSVDSVASQLFGKTFKFECPVVTVYQDVAHKPAIGEELNVPATITLKLEPKKNRSLENHIELLKTRTGMEFVTYDPVTHFWTFKVKHFSVWGLIEESDDENNLSINMDGVRALKKRQDEEEEDASQAYSRIYENDGYKRELKKQRIARQTSGLPGGWDFDTTNTDALLLLKQQILKNEIGDQLQHHKKEKSANALAANVSDITIESDAEEAPSEKEDMILGDLNYQNENEDLDYLKQIVPALPGNANLKEIVNEKAFEPSIENQAEFALFNRVPAVATSDDWLLQLELSNDVNSALSPLLTVSRKPKLSLRTIHDIVFSDFDENANPNHVSTPLNGRKTLADVTEEERLPIDADVQRTVQVLLLSAKVSEREDDFAKFDLEPSLSFRDIASVNKGDSQLLELASILLDKVNLSGNAQWKDIGTDDGLRKRALIYEQRRLLTRWLERKNAQLIKSSLNDVLEEIFAYLLNNNLTAAVEKAVSTHNTHLATLMTLLDSNDNVVKDLAKAQLNYWEAEGQTFLIPGPIVKIYKLLAGEIDDVAKNLTFSQSLALKLFCGPPVEEVSEVLSQFSLDVSGDNCQALFGVYRSFKTAGIDEADGKLLESSLSPKLKWLVFKILHQDKPGHYALNDDLSVALAQQLEKRLQWKDALFVYSMVNDDKLAVESIRRTVIKCVKSEKGLSPEDEEFFVGVLKIPKVLIHEANALKEDEEHDYWAKGYSLVAANLWNEAHDNIVRQLGPSTVIENDYASWSKLVGMISTFPDNGRIIPSWQHGAGLLKDFFEICQATENFTNIDGTKLKSCLENLALFPTNNSVQSKIAVNLMAKTLVDAALDNSQETGFVESTIKNIDVGENERLYFHARLRTSESR